MGEVVDLEQKRNEREANAPHIAAHVFCEQCMHEWVGVIPVTVWGKLECPSCHNMTGVWEP